MEEFARFLEQRRREDRAALEIPIRAKPLGAQRPSVFQGTALDPIQAAEWISKMEDIFEVMDISEEHKVICAAQVCKGEVHTWWKATKHILGANGHKPIWSEFTKAFEQKYFPPCYKRMKQIEFLNLRQGTMTLQEYVMKFSECARFVDEYGDTEAKKARQFEEGLREDIRILVKTFQLPTYAEVLEKAQIIECDKWKEGAATRIFWAKGLWRKGFDICYDKPQCRKCHKRHLGDCRIGINVCYRCGEKGHMAKDCNAPPKDTAGQ
ncbi:hypothetical protein NE237_008435 [Protea cynaroides]|uniref:CCHC-type domain-containing protein n=1 Tax=Protea cynaroides TaxID=273540 RepID=A0A9Q0QZS2_9MAGN|nr:hypothetical protein NE237_008435 [Protea cynaroides]